MLSRKPQQNDSMFYDPILQKQLQLYDLGNIHMLLMEAPQMMEDDDMDQLQKAAINITSSLVFGSVMGVALNVQLKKIKPLDIFNRPFAMRAFLRIPVFFLPHSLLFLFSTGKHFENAFNIRMKYWTRLYKFQRTGDIRHLAPTDEVRKHFMRPI